ncbi:MAG: amidohydrolase family protein [Candidatus Poribacteria bacterium]
MSKNEDLYPHSPDVFERETEDNGFSKGWGLHFQPSEKYWIDCHNHASAKTGFMQAFNEWFDWAFGWRLAKVIIVDGHPKSLKNAFSSDPFDYEELSKTIKDDKRLAFLYAPGVDTPDVEPLLEALECGAKGLKLWSPTFIIEGRRPDEFEDPKWEPFFKIVNEKRLPILWHVTQRMTASPYTGGALHAYWSEGWKKGIKWTNEDLLQSFLRIANTYPNGHFIGAHQHYVGWDRLEQIFEEYPNTYIDTSIGCFVRWGDVMYPEDQRRIREFFIKYADRIIFGTDTGIGKDAHQETSRLGLMGHIRFIRQLNLPYDELQKVSHQNAERLFRLEPSSDKRVGNIRP